MNNLIIFIIIAILLIIFLHKLCIKNTSKLEHLTLESDEAIQNIASLYNVNKMTIGELNSTGDVNAVGKVVAGEMIQAPLIKTTNGNIDTLSTGQIKLGNKWILSGGKDAGGFDDQWLRLLNPAGAHYGGIAATFYDTSMSNTIKGYIDVTNANTNARINALSTVYTAAAWPSQDVGQVGFGVGSMDGCISACKGRGAKCAMMPNNNSDLRCWCRNLPIINSDGNWKAAILI